MRLDADVITSYETPDMELVDDLLKEELKKTDRKIVVLDDDPTGVQTVHDIYAVSYTHLTLPTT